MIRLIRVEIKRFWARRITWIVSVGLLAALAFSAFGVLMSIPSEEMRIENEKYFQEEVQRWGTDGEQMIAECLADQERDREASGDPTIEWGCDMMGPPLAEDWLGWFQDTQFAKAAEGNLSTAGIFIFLAGVLIAASAFAAELTTGALGNWLTFEPRRIRVLFSKMAASAISVIPIAAVGIVAFTAAIWVAYSLRNAMGVVTAEVWQDLSWMGLRILGLAALLAAVGSALGALTRHTAAALGVLAAYFLVIDTVLRATLPTWSPWLISTNLQAVLNNGTTYAYEVCKLNSTGERMCEYVEKSVSFTHGGIYMVVIAAIVIGITTLVFRRRDVL